ncbi:MAG: pirin family protein [Deltaproteobacteria bacterium]|nr:pirin family protein [Deltaproteobacteria bacterium]
MIALRRANERGHANHGWLDSFHTFSFADYYDPRFEGFRALRVINEDRVAPGQGFGTHAHRDMEIVTYVLEGALAHKDSMGNGSVLQPGDVQRMTAGTGVRHSEFNGSEKEEVHFLQIWIIPGKQGLAPGYEEKRFAPEDKLGKLRLVASPDGRDGSVTVHQDATISVALLEPGQKVEHGLAKGRHAWVHVASGAVKLEGETLRAGDAAAVTQETLLRIEGVERGEVLVFDLA